MFTDEAYTYRGAEDIRFLPILLKVLCPEYVAQDGCEIFSYLISEKLFLSNRVGANVIF